MVVNNSCCGDVGIHSQGQDRDRMGRGGENNQVAMETLPKAEKDSRHCPPLSLGTSTSLPTFRLWVYFQKKKCSAIQLYLCIHTENHALAKFKMHLTQGIGPTFRPNLPISKERRYTRIKNDLVGTSLMAQWLRIRLPMQETWVQSLVQEDPTCRGATKPVRHNY